jgi:hypothetical protein
MAATPQPPARPSTPPPHAPPPKPHADPQDAKLEAQAVPPRWDQPKEAKKRPEFTPKPAIDPRAEKPPAGFYADGMGSAEEQRARSAWIEAHGMKAYHEAVDDRSDEEKTKKQIPGVVPPTKRE